MQLEHSLEQSRARHVYTTFPSLLILLVEFLDNLIRHIQSLLRIDDDPEQLIVPPIDDRDIPLALCNDLGRILKAIQADFTAAELELILRGFQPEEMEQKWSVCCDGDWVYFCRSWTKFMIFALRLERTASGARVADSLVSRDAKQYRSTDLDYDRRLVRELIDGWLLCPD